jgi:hypothetical protein
MTIDWTAPTIEPLADSELAPSLARRIDGLTGPLGALVGGVAAAALMAAAMI